MALGSVGAGSAHSALDAATDRASDAALAKATVKLATDKKAGAAADVLRTDQQSLTQATKAASKADLAVKADGGTVRLTA